MHRHVQLSHQSRALAVALGLILVFLSPTIAFAASWRAVKVLPPSCVGDGGASAVGHNDRVYYFDGTSTCEYNPSTNTWSIRAPIPASTFYAIAVTGYGGMILVAGGYPGGVGTSATNAAWQYNPTTNTWKAVASMSVPRADAAAALGPDRRIYVFGGDEGDGDPQSNYSPTNSVEAFDPYADTWSAVAPMSRVAYGAAAVTVGSTIYVCGGELIPYPTSEVDAYSVSSGTWSLAAPMPRAEAYGGAALARNGKIFVVGGVQRMRRHPYQTVPYVSAYNPATGIWSPGPSLPMAAQDNAVTAVPGGSLYSIGGYSLQGGTPGNQVYAFG